MTKKEILLTSSEVPNTTADQLLDLGVEAILSRNPVVAQQVVEEAKRRIGKPNTLSKDPSDDGLYIALGNGVVARYVDRFKSGERE